jgi:asparagine synthase (glutamine-hydrolysing)
MFRYMALIWDPQSPEAAHGAIELEEKIKATATAWVVTFKVPGIHVLMSDSSGCFGAHLLCDNAGVVVGEVFARLKDLQGDDTAYRARFNRFETYQALRSHGRSLVSEFWGNYVAIVVDGDAAQTGQPTGGQRATYVLKDPSGTLPCNITEHHGIKLLFSSLEDCRSIGLSFPVNWEFARTRAVHGFFDTEVPTLLGVSTVHRGECLRLDWKGRLVSRSLYWHPLHFAHAWDLITDSVTAAKALRATVGSCVNSLARHHSRLLAQTSGGLDSSIVLGCLGAAPSKPSITCYTGYAVDSVCDERRWARHAAKCGGHRHLEICQDPGEIVFRDAHRLAPSVQPASYYSHLRRGSLEREIAAECGATATFTGDSGDSTLCANTYSFAADHSLRRHLLGMRTLKTALRVASRRDQTIWQVLARAVRREVFGAGKADALRRQSGFNRLVAPTLKRETEGKNDQMNIWASIEPISEEIRLRLGTLAFPPDFYDLSTSTKNPAPHAISPLCAQPVMEICLRIPVDVHFDAGRSRGLARRAFADVVPEAILRRQWKDRPLLFFDEVIQRNQGFIREHLLDGALAKEEILDRSAVELALKSGPTRSTAISAEIMSHLDLELWIRDCARAL